MIRYALLYVLSSFAIILTRKRACCFALSSSCLVTVSVLWFFLIVPWVGLQCMIVVFPDHTHLLFGTMVCRFQQRVRTVNIVNVQCQIYLKSVIGLNV